MSFLYQTCNFLQKGTLKIFCDFEVTGKENVPPFGIIAGNPGKLIGYRYNDKEIIELIQKIKWWDWSEKKIIDNRNIFTLEENELKEELLKLDS